MPKYSGRSGGDENLVINLTVSGQEAAEKEVKTFIATLNTMLKGAGNYNINEYFETTKASIDSVQESLKTFVHDLENAGNAGDFLKSYNAYIAQFDGSIKDAANHIKSEFGDDIAARFNTTFENIIASAERAAPAIANVFDAERLRDSFSSFTYISKELGADISKIFSAINNGDSGALAAEVDRLRDSLTEADYTIERLKQRIEELGDSAANNKLKVFQDTATRMRREFQSLLIANGVGSDDIGKFYAYTRAIENGTMTVRDAFAKAKQELGSLFSTPIDAGGLEEALSRIESKLEQIAEKSGSAKRASGGDAAAGGLLENAEEGVAAAEKETAALEALSQKKSGIDALTAALTAVAAGMKNSGEAATNAFDSINRLVESMTRLGDVDESKLGHVATIMSSLAGAAELKAGTTSTDNLIRLVASINNIGDGKGIQTLKSLATIDFTRLSNLKVSGATLTHLATELPKIAGVSLAPLKELAGIDWTNLSALKIPKANLENLTALVEKTGIKVDSSGFDSMQSAIDKIGASLDGLQEKIRATFDLTNAISQAGELTKQYAGVKAALDATARVTRATTPGGGQGGPGGVNNQQLRELINLYIEWYDVLSRGERARAQGGRDSDVMRYAQEAHDLEVLITNIERENEALAEQAAISDRVKKAARDFTDLTGRNSAKEAAAALKEQARAANEAAKAAADAQAKAAKDAAAALKEQDKAAREAAKATADAQAKAAKDAAVNAAEQKKGLQEVIALYEKYYDLKSKKIGAVHAGKIDDADSFRTQAEAVGELIAKLETLLPELTDQARRSDEVTAAVERYNNAVQKGQSAANDAMASRAEKEAAAIEKYKQQLESLSTLNTTGKNQILFSGNEKSLSEYKASLEELQKKFDEIAAAADGEKDTAVAAFEAQRKEVEELRASLNKLEQNQTKANQIANRIETYASKNGAAPLEIREQWQAWIAELRSGKAVAENTLDDINREFAKTTTHIKIANDGGKTFFQQMKEGWSKFGGWSLVTRSFTKIISLFKNAVTAVKDVDSAMTELRKVTDLTSAGYERFYENATKMAGKVGSSLADTINAVADFSRLGFDIDQASKLAEASMVYFNVGDGIESISDATESLISTMKAFDIQAEDSMSIVDMFNEVGKAKMLPMPVVTRCLAECYIGQSSAGLCA